MSKVEIFPIKIAARKEKTSEELTPIISIDFVPDEESFNKTDSIPTINVNLVIESNEENHINYICGLNWFDNFFTHTGIYNLLRRVNLACNITTSEGLELSDEIKENLNTAFSSFVNKLKTIIDDITTYVTLWPENPAFTITIGKEEPEESTPSSTEEVKDESKSE